MRKKRSETQGNSKNYEWQTSDGDKPGEGGAPYSFVHIMLTFLVFSGLGAYLMQ